MSSIFGRRHAADVCFRPKADISGLATEPPIGVLGKYFANGDPTDECYGLYLRLDGRLVLVDIREDQHLEQRKRHALYLVAHAGELEVSFAKFVGANPKFAGCHIGAIGLHSKALDQGEVFWDPDGY